MRLELHSGILQESGIHPSADKRSAILNCPVPTSEPELMRFLYVPPLISVYIRACRLDHDPQRCHRVFWQRQGKAGCGPPVGSAEIIMPLIYLYEPTTSRAPMHSISGAQVELDEDKSPGSIPLLGKVPQGLYLRYKFLEERARILDVIFSLHPLRLLILPETLHFSIKSHLLWSRRQRCLYGVVFFP